MNSNIFHLANSQVFLGFLNQTLICKQSTHVKVKFLWTKVIWMVLQADLSAKIWVWKKILTIFAWRMLWKRRKIDSWHFSIDSLRRVLSVIGHKIFPSFFNEVFSTFKHLQIFFYFWKRNVFFKTNKKVLIKYKG